MASPKGTPTAILPAYVTPEYLKRVEAAASASARLSSLYRQIRETLDAITADMADLACPQSAAHVGGEDQEFHTGQTEPGRGERCYKDGRWHERHWPYERDQHNLDGYCGGCLRRVPLARKLKALRAKKGAATRAVLAAGRKLISDQVTRAEFPYTEVA